MKILFGQQRYSTNLKSSSNTPQQQYRSHDLANDSFCKSSIPQKKAKSTPFLAFKGKLDDMATKVGKGLFTKADNYFAKGTELLIEGSKKKNQETVKQAYEFFEKSVNHFEKALPKLKSVLKEPEYAERLNHVGTKYTELGNMSQNQSFFARAYELFDEASEIAERSLIDKEQEFSMFAQNKETLYNALNPPVEKKPIGFLRDQEKEVQNTVAHKEKMGFIK